MRTFLHVLSDQKILAQCFCFTFKQTVPFLGTAGVTSQESKTRVSDMKNVSCHCWAVEFWCGAPTAGRQREAVSAGQSDYWFRGFVQKQEGNVLQNLRRQWFKGTFMNVSIAPMLLVILLSKKFCESPRIPKLSSAALVALFQPISRCKMMIFPIYLFTYV